MRIVALAGILLACVSAAPAIACDDGPPLSAQREPTVPYWINRVPIEFVRNICSNGDPQSGVIACAMKPTHPKVDSRWMITIDESLKGAELTCAILYEKAHLPPNNWGDPKIEQRSTMHAYGLSYY